jgi:hypothetical protein
MLQCVACIAGRLLHFFGKAAAHAIRTMALRRWWQQLSPVDLQPTTLCKDHDVEPRAQASGNVGCRKLCKAALYMCFRHFPLLVWVDARGEQILRWQATG